MNSVASSFGFDSPVVFWIQGNHSFWVPVCSGLLVCGHYTGRNARLDMKYFTHTLLQYCKNFEVLFHWYMALHITVKKYEARLMLLPLICDLISFCLAQGVVYYFESPNLVSPILLDFTACWPFWISFLVTWGCPV